jgi:hypothetical protein
MLAKESHARGKASPRSLLAQASIGGKPTAGQFQKTLESSSVVGIRLWRERIFLSSVVLQVQDLGSQVLELLERFLEMEPTETV